MSLVQWSFLQYKKTSKGSQHAPVPSFLHSVTQIGSKLLIYGGCDYFGKPLSQMLMYDTVNFQWSSPNSSAGSGAGEGVDVLGLDSPGARYGHSATLVEMHPPKILIYGGIVAGGTFEFDVPDSVEENSSSNLPGGNRRFMSWRRKGKANQEIEETDESVYYLQLLADKWEWSKPVNHGKRDANTIPPARCEHSAVKASTNEVVVFGGWSCNDNQPLADLWAFNVVDNEWCRILPQGILPKPRFRHTAEVIGDKMYVLGGCDNIEDICDGVKNLSMSVLSLDSYRWSHPELRGIDPFPRSGHSTAIIGAHSIAVFGGKRSNEVFLNDLVLIDVRSYSTTVVNAVSQYLPTPVANCSLSVVGNKVFVFGGTDVKGNCFNDIRSLDVGPYLDAHDISVGEGAASDYCFKILIIGDSTVGKSALLTRFSENLFLSSYTSTIGIDFNSRMIRVEGSICKLEIWDTAGQERFSTITANYYRGAQGALLVYDISQKPSFTHVRNWFERARQLGGSDIEAVLVGNKTDLEADRKVTYAEGDQLAAELGIPFVETSALNGENVEQAFVCMTANIKRSVDRRGLTGLKTNAMHKAGGVQLAKGEKKSGMLSSMCGCT